MRLLVAVRAPAVARGLGAEVRGEVAARRERDAVGGLGERGADGALGGAGNSATLLLTSLVLNAARPRALAVQQHFC